MDYFEKRRAAVFAMRHEKGLKYADIAKQFGVTGTRIIQIVRREAWRQLTLRKQGNKTAIKAYEARRSRDRAVIQFLETQPPRMSSKITDAKAAEKFGLSPAYVYAIRQAAARNATCEDVW